MVKKSTVKHQAAVQTLKEVQDFWEKAHIPIRPFQHAVKKLEDLVGKWEDVKKNKRWRSETQQKNEEECQIVIKYLDQISILLTLVHQHSNFTF